MQLTLQEQQFMSTSLSPSLAIVKLSMYTILVSNSNDYVDEDNRISGQSVWER